MEATELDALDVIDILRYAMTDTVEDCITPKLHSDGKLTNKKVNHIYIVLLIYLHLYLKNIQICVAFYDLIFFFTDTNVYKDTGKKGKHG